MRWCKPINGGWITSKKVFIATPVKGYLIQDEGFTLLKNGVLVVYPQYWWDGATGALDTESILKASLGHDILCILINEGRLPIKEQPVVDEILPRLMTRYWEHLSKHGTLYQRAKERVLRPFLKLRRWWVYMAVRIYQTNKHYRAKRG